MHSPPGASPLLRGGGAKQSPPSAVGVCENRGPEALPWWGEQPGGERFGVGVVGGEAGGVAQTHKRLSRGVSRGLGVRGARAALQRDRADAERVRKRGRVQGSPAVVSPPSSSRGGGTHLPRGLLSKIRGFVFCRRPAPANTKKIPGHVSPPLQHSPPRTYSFPFRGAQAPSRSTETQTRIKFLLIHWVKGINFTVINRLGQFRGMTICLGALH